MAMATVGRVLSRASEGESILPRPPGPSGLRDDGIRVDSSHMALNTEAKKIHKGSPLPKRPHSHPLPDPLPLLWLLQSPF